MNAWVTENYLKVSAKNLVFTCEHGGNQVPVVYRNLFRNRKTVLNSHRGIDHGALQTAKKLSTAFQSKLIYSEISRLLIDLNRSLYHRNLFSDITKNCDAETRQLIINKYYLPYRKSVKKQLDHIIKNNGLAVHLSVHSFTPELDGVTRSTDIGLLYDPERKPEKTFCQRLQTNIINTSGTWRVRCNYPYKGNADGFTTYLRKQYSSQKYLGIEIEINQNIFKNPKLTKDLYQSLVEGLNNIILN